MNGEHVRWDLVSLDEAPATKRLAKRAGRIARLLHVEFAEQGDTEAAPPSSPLVLLAGGSSSARKEFLKRDRKKDVETVAIEDQRDDTGRPECPYRRALSPAEQLLSLACEAEQLVKRYAERLNSYANASGDRTLRACLMRSLSEGRGRLPASQLAELTLVLAPETIRAPWPWMPFFARAGPATTGGGMARPSLTHRSSSFTIVESNPP